MKPIKPVGEVTSPKNKNTSLAKETLEIIKKKQYTSRNGNIVDLSDNINFAVKNTIHYKDFVAPDFYMAGLPTVEVVNETTSQAAVRLKELGKTNLVALNFAAARNPGGGFLAGAVAQEEDLCRDSALYACLKSKPMFYNNNIMCENSYYTDDIIYSPFVPFFRDEYHLLLEQPYSLSIISAPAPNVNAMKTVDEELLAITLITRAQKILQIAHNHGHKNILLGAWGCGAFGNDPADVAAIFRAALKAVPVFEHVCFPVYDTRTPQYLFETFKEAFSNG